MERKTESEREEEKVICFSFRFDWKFQRSTCWIVFLSFLLYFNQRQKKYKIFVTKKFLRFEGFVANRILKLGRAKNEKSLKGYRWCDQHDILCFLWTISNLILCVLEDWEDFLFNLVSILGKSATDLSIFYFRNDSLICNKNLVFTTSCLKHICIQIFLFSNGFQQLIFNFLNKLWCQLKLSRWKMFFNKSFYLLKNMQEKSRKASIVFVINSNSFSHCFSCSHENLCVKMPSATFP